jgi:hypothetical protein
VRPGIKRTSDVPPRTRKANDIFLLDAYRFSCLFL